MPELGSFSVSFKQGYQLMKQYHPPVRGGGEIFSVKLFWKLPCGHSQRYSLVVILNPAKLSAIISHHIIKQFKEYSQAGKTEMKHSIHL